MWSPAEWADPFFTFEGVIETKKCLFSTMVTPKKRFEWDSCNLANLDDYFLKQHFYVHKVK